MPIAKTVDEWKAQSVQARKDVFADLGIEESSQAAQLFDEHIWQPTNYRVEQLSFDTNYTKQQLAVREADDASAILTRKLDLLRQTSGNEGKSIADTVEKASRLFTRKVEGPTLPERVLKEPYVTEEGKFRPLGVVGAVGGAILGWMLPKNMGLHWGKRLGLTAFMGVMGGAATFAIDWVRNTFFKGNTSDTPAEAIDTSDYRSSTASTRDISTLNAVARREAIAAGRGATTSTSRNDMRSYNNPHHSTTAYNTPNGFNIRQYNNRFGYPNFNTQYPNHWQGDALPRAYPLTGIAYGNVDIVGRHHDGLPGGHHQQKAPKNRLKPIKPYNISMVNLENNHSMGNYSGRDGGILSSYDEEREGTSPTGMVPTPIRADRTARPARWL